MSYEYDSDDNIIEGAVAEEVVIEAEEKKNPIDEQEYYELPDSPDARTRVWSVISLFTSILSVVLCAFYYVSLPLAAFSIICAVMSRRRLGYFDRLSVAGLLVGLVGVVFGIFSLVVNVTGVLDALKR